MKEVTFFWIYQLWGRVNNTHGTNQVSSPFDIQEHLNTLFVDVGQYLSFSPYSGQVISGFGLTEKSVRSPQNYPLPLSE